MMATVAGHINPSWCLIPRRPGRPGIRNLPTLNRDALRDRKAKVITPAQAAEYVASKHEMTIEDVRALRKEVADWRRIYEPVYRHIRDHLAHNKKGVSDLDALLAMTNIEEMKRCSASSMRCTKVWPSST